MKLVTPILDEELMLAIRNAVVMFSKKAQWKALGMHRLREQGAALLFYGEPGTGKTITAKWLAWELKLMLHEIDFSMVGSDTPGQLAHNIIHLFEAATIPDEHGNSSLVFIDECDSLLVSRQKLGHDSLWMLEPINALLSQIGTYPGLVVLATNQDPFFLDPALERRLLGRFNFGIPSRLTREAIWLAKWPKKLPSIQAEYDIPDYPFTGAEIENIIIEYVSDTLRRNVEFNIKDIYKIIDKEWKRVGYQRGNLLPSTSLLAQAEEVLSGGK
jgi:SpoVK/Ycf46/Vps4 family AAA+-type ATPase